MTRPGAVTAAAIVCLLWSVVTLLFGIGFMLAAFVPNAGAASPIPNFTAYMVSLGAFTTALSVLGIATAIGLLRLRPWARTSILIFSGFAAPLCLLTSAVAAFIPLPETPGLPAGGNTIIRALVVGIYAMPLLITIWWLVQFNTRRTKEAFAGDGATGPSRPLIVPIVGWGNLVGGIACIIPVAMGLPAFALGFMIRGVGAQIFYLVFGAMSATLGWELLKMRELARVLTIGWLALLGANSLHATLSPTARAQMLEVQQEMAVGQPQAPEFDSTAFLVASAVATVLLIGVGIWLLVRAKPAFAEERAETGSGILG